MKTKEINVYSFEELSESAKEKAREWYRNGNLDYEWWDFVYEDAKTIGALMGIDIDKIYFSGFWSQGDGACFEGYYQYKKGSVKAVKEYAPQDKELHQIAQGLVDLQRCYLYSLTASVSHRGHYYHENCTSFDVYDKRRDDGIVGEVPEESLKEFLRDFMRWIYKRLENEWEWLNSDEAVDENIIANEYEFDEEGRRI